jgi:hypothetical protein
VFQAFVIHVHHYTLSIHTARFPTSYLKWVTDPKAEKICESLYCILYKVSATYDLSEPDQRLNAARDILILLWAIKQGNKKTDENGLFVARAVVKQIVGEEATKSRKRNQHSKLDMHITN